MTAETHNGDRVELSNAQDDAAPRQKRARGQLSCVPCRVGKLKCDRVRDPGCNQCIKRNRLDACHYVPPPTKARPAANVKGRIRQLEGLVRTLMEQQNESSKEADGEDDEDSNESSPGSDNEQMPDAEDKTRKPAVNVEQSFGKLDINQGEVSYSNQEHWTAILSSLSEIQKDLGDDEELTPATTQSSNSKSTSDGYSPESPPAQFSEHGIFGTTRPVTRDELLRKLPDKRATDRLLALYFQSPEPFKIIIHAPTFQNEYKRLWRDQSVSDMWLGLLFAILSIAEGFGLRSFKPGTPEAAACADKVEEYHSLAASAAVLADFTRPKPYTLECLIMYMVGIRGINATLDAWLAMGLIVRLALRMGYHRDADFYSAKVNPFEGEMRRRVWAQIFMIDVLTSFQLGLPSMVRAVAADTQPPRNLLDRDFAPQSGFLAAGRSDDELTPCSYIRAKLGLMRVFSEAAEISHATSPPSTDVVLKLDRDLEHAKAHVPPALQMPDVSEIVTDPAEQLMCRFNLDLLYLKCKIVLFRRYMLVPLGQLSEHEQSRGIGASREACIKSARAVLNHHHTIYNATQPGGQLEQMRWYMGSISTHDFLLASMVLCLELSQQLQRDRMLRISNGMLCPTRTAMMAALEETHRIWTSPAQLTTADTFYQERKLKTFKEPDNVGDTAKAAKAMAVMLSRLKAQRNSADTTYTPSRAEILNGESCTEGHLFEKLGATPQGARNLRSKGDATYGVISYHDWSDIPADFSFPTSEGSPQISAPTSYSHDQPTPNGHRTSLPLDVRGSLGQGLGVDGLREDGDIDIDWQAWGHQIMNAPSAQDMDWLGQDLLASSPVPMPLPNALGANEASSSYLTDILGSMRPQFADNTDGFDDMDLASASFTPFLNDKIGRGFTDHIAPQS